MRDKKQKQREQFAADIEQKFQVRMRNIQQRLYSALLDRLSGFDTDGDRLRFNVRNVTNTNQVVLLLEKRGKSEFKKLLEWLVNQLRKLFGLNTQYFQSFSDVNKARTEAILRKVMLRYGYDIKTRQIVRTGVLSALADLTPVAGRVGELISQSISARMTLPAFKQAFRRVFVNPAGLGLLESQFDRLTHDLFQDFDRETQKAYAEELQLTYAIYSGTLIKTTRPFCEARNNNIYDSKEIDSWNKLDWKGKRPGVPVTTQCGGYNCRHHLSYLSEQTARKLAENRGGINNYN